MEISNRKRRCYKGPRINQLIYRRCPASLEKAKTKANEAKMMKCHVENDNGRDDDDDDDYRQLATLLCRQLGEDVSWCTQWAAAKFAELRDYVTMMWVEMIKIMGSR